MPEVSKYVGIYPSNDAELLMFMSMVADLCDFMLEEQEYKYSLSYENIYELKAFALSFNTPVERVKDLENELAGARKALSDKKEKDFPSMSSYFNKIKASAGCKPALLKKYPIKGKTISVDVHNLNADIRIKKVANRHELSFSKHCIKKLNMNLYLKKNGESSFNLINTIVKSPFIIKETLTEGAMLFGIYNVDNKEVGNPSNIILINP